MERLPETRKSSAASWRFVILIPIASATDALPPLPLALALPANSSEINAGLLIGGLLTFQCTSLGEFTSRSRSKKRSRFLGKLASISMARTRTRAIHLARYHR